MRIAIYHPNLNLFGGGEMVAITIANSLSKKHEVDILTHYLIAKKELEDFFSLKLNKVNIIICKKIISKLPTLRSAKPSLLLKGSYEKLENYDLVIDTCTNGWFDKKLKAKTICYIHYPFFYRKKKGLKKFMNKLIIQPENAFQYDKIFCNSNFTKEIVSKFTNKKLEVLYPPVEVDKIKPRKKLNRIITIGRFTYDKKHEVMIEAFKELCKTFDGYDFHIIGAFNENASLYKKEYFEMLKEKAKGYQIHFHVNMPHDEVLKFLEESKIYWHARGYGEIDLNEYENFGITTVEAMAAGCVPIVINLGAQTEIVEHGKNGYCWNKPEELIEYTIKVLNNGKILKELSKKAIKKSKIYNTKIFEKKIIETVNSLF